MRILFKTPHQVFFRRCFFVKKYDYVEDKMVVTHGLRGRKVTHIPLLGTVVRFFGKR